MYYDVVGNCLKGMVCPCLHLRQHLEPCLSVFQEGLGRGGGEKGRILVCVSECVCCIHVFVYTEH